MFRIGKTVTAGVAGSHQVIVERYGGLMRSAARPPLGSLSTELEKMASGWRSHSPSLLFRMALKAAALAADCEELWKDDCGNADTRGPLQLSGKADKKEADSDQFSVKSNHFTNVRSHRLHSWKQQGAEKKKKRTGIWFTSAAHKWLQQSINPCSDPPESGAKAAAPARWLYVCSF